MNIVFKNVITGLCLVSLTLTHTTTSLANTIAHKISTHRLKRHRRKAPIKLDIPATATKQFVAKNVVPTVNNENIRVLAQQTKRLKNIYSIAFCISLGTLCYQMASAYKKKFAINFDKGDSK